LMPKGEWAHNLPMWWCVSSLFYLSILGCGHVWTICVVWWTVNLEPFKFVRLNRASVEPRLYICDAWWLLFFFVDLYILSYASRLLYHIYALVYANWEWSFF
jgi:hypothetical protein